MNNSIVEIKLNASKVKVILIYLVVVLVLLNLIGLFLHYILGLDFVHGFVIMFNLDKENNIPTYFSSLLLLIASSNLYAISKAMKKHDDIYTNHWLYLSIVFLFLSIDETASFHELLILPLRSVFNISSGIFYFSWVIVGFAVVIILATIYFPFFLKLPKSIKVSFAFAAGLYIGGALGLELLGGFYSSNYGENNLIYSLITTIEETLEMIGIVIFINSLIKFLVLNKLNILLDINS